MNFIKEIFEKGSNKDMHNKFVRFGKGHFSRFLFDITKGKNLKVKCSYDFSNDLVKLISENIRESMKIKGKIIAGWDFEEKLKELGLSPKEYKKRGKLYTAELDSEISPEQLRKVYEMFKDNYLLIDIEAESFKLKTGNSLPKPGKELKINFCKATLPPELKDEFAWDIDDFKKLSIRHELDIDDIIIPEELKNDPARARVESRRKGKITRILSKDGEEKKKQAEFEA